jgi:hypothetical protein
MIQKVGKSIVEGIKPRKFAYRDIPFDEDGWADAERFMPADYDLVFLKIEGKKSVSGWSTGNSWDGLKLEKADKVKYWKRKPDEKN